VAAPSTFGALWTKPDVKIPLDIFKEAIESVSSRAVSVPALIRAWRSSIVASANVN
jgi:hypothetical protein